MKIQNIQSNTMKAKQRFVTPEMHQNIRFLLDKMSEGSEYNSNGDYFRARIFKEISTKNSKIRFKDGNSYLGNNIKDKSLTGETLFTIGKTELVIDNKTGEIIDYYKPFYSTWGKIMKKMGEYLEFFKSNFDNIELVKQKFLPIQGFTEQGYEKFKKLTEGIND